MAILDSFVIPAERARAFELEEGTKARIIAHEGTQVCDIAIISRDDPSEYYCSDMSVYINMMKGIGNMDGITELYSRPPGMKLLAVVTDDTMGHHNPWSGGMCCSLLYSIRDDDPDHPNCADNILGALHDHGMTLEKVPEVFTVGMNVAIEDDMIRYEEPTFGKGAFVELRAESDLILAASACPNDTTVMNEYEPKAIKIELRD